MIQQLETLALEYDVRAENMIGRPLLTKNNNNPALGLIDLRNPSHSKRTQLHPNSLHKE